GHAYEQLDAGGTDIRITWGYSPSPLSLRSMHLFYDRIVCVTDPKHRDSSGPLTLAEYLSAHHIRAQGADRTTTGKAVDHVIAKLGKSLPVNVVIQNYLSIPKVICDTGLVATVPERVALELIKG